MTEGLKRPLKSSIPLSPFRVVVFLLSGEASTVFAGEPVKGPKLLWAVLDAVEPKLDRGFRCTTPGMPKALTFAGRVEERTGAAEFVEALEIPVWLRLGETIGEPPNRGKSKRKLSFTPIEFRTAAAGAADATIGRPP